MADLARLKAQHDSLAELGQLVGALRSMAASRAREAQSALAGTRAYRAIVGRAIAGIGPGPAAARSDPGGGALLMVITSENGFVGGFNARLMDHALVEREGADRLAIVGRRGQVLAAERGVAPDLALPMTSRAAGVTQLARRIAGRLAGLGAVRVVHAAPRPGAAFDLRLRQLLPLQPDTEAATGPVPPLHHLPAEVLLDRLAQEYLFAGIADALMESLASENAARLQTMDAAAHNVDDRLDRLVRDERVARQDQTTADLLDVIVGTEAVNHG